MTLLDELQAASAPGAEPTEEAFRRLFPAGLDALGLEDHEMATSLWAARSTINRWRRGVMVPHMAVHRVCLGVLARKLAQVVGDDTSE